MSQDESKLSTGSEVTALQVVDFLRSNPDFLNSYPKAFDNQTIAARKFGDGVSDFQSALIRRLRADVAGHNDKQRELLDTSRANLSIQSRVHECVLALLEARSFEKVIETVATDFTVFLGLDVVALCIEAEDGEWVPENVEQGLRLVESGTVHRVLGGEDIILNTGDHGVSTVFGEAAGIVCSEALLRLEITASTPPALLAFGSREPGKFHPGQAIELITFLAEVLECVIRGWLSQPD